MKAENRTAQAEKNKAREELMMKERERAYKENVKRLDEKMEQERVSSEKHFQEVLLHRLRRQEQLMNDGFAGQFEQMQSSLNDLEIASKRKICVVM